MQVVPPRISIEWFFYLQDLFSVFSLKMISLRCTKHEKLEDCSQCYHKNARRYAICFRIKIFSKAVPSILFVHEISSTCFCYSPIAFILKTVFLCLPFQQLNYTEHENVTKVFCQNTYWNVYKVAGTSRTKSRN